MHILTIIRRQAEIRPDHLAFSSLDGGERVTYRQLIGRVDNVAQSLTERGCRGGERCGLMLADGADFLQSALGVLKAGLCLVPIANVFARAREGFPNQGGRGALAAPGGLSFVSVAICEAR